MIAAIVAALVAVAGAGVPVDPYRAAAPIGNDANYPVCTVEDGSAPGQPFPCYWDGGANGRGDHYVLTGPWN